MRSTAKTIGILLIVIGAVGVIWGGVTFIKDRNVTEIGSIEIVTEEKEHIPISPILGVVALIAGGILVGVASRRNPDLTT
jgi:drug/metabolite transporter (DMT)-like permease